MMNRPYTETAAVEDIKPICKICRNCELETARFSNSIEHDGKRIEVHELECWLCLECGAEPIFDDQRKRNDERFARARAALL